MKFSRIRLLFRGIVTCSIITLLMSSPYSTKAQSGELDNKGKIRVETSDKTEPLDPENPINPVDPDTDYSTVGDLRIDFISPISFGANKITQSNRKYEALAQQYKDETSARANYIQITNQQDTHVGWSLQIRQEYQFTSITKDPRLADELTGAVLSLDKGWANSLSNSPPPVVTRETIAINEIGVSYEVASAKPNEARGTWFISFGASEKNHNNQPTTLFTATNGKSNQLVDKKTIIKNSAVTLKVPDSVKIQPVSYETELTWVLGRLP